MAASAAPSAMSVPARQRPWWLTLIIGIAAVAIGAILLFGTIDRRIDTYMFLVKALGLYWVIWGILELVYMFIDHSAWGWKLFMGVVSIIAGGSILMYPVSAAMVLPQVFVWVLGFWALMEGIILLFMAFKGGGWAAGILAVISIVLGGILLSSAGQIGTGIAMLWAGAIWAFIGGFVLIFQAFRTRKA